MCTAITFQSKDHYFGRNLDLEYHYHENVTITPRQYEFHFRNGTVIRDHFAMIGMATISNGFPLYYEATNEKGLSIAGLNFPGNAVYFGHRADKVNITPFELIPWLLCQFQTVEEALPALGDMNLWRQDFSPEYPLSPLHWLLADKSIAVTIESTESGIHICKNPVGVLTNNPPFDYHLYHLANYLNVTAMPPCNRFSAKLDLTPYSLGMGAIGLPGDPSSPSRFVRAAFTKFNSLAEPSEKSSVNQFFHILGSVIQQRGVTNVREREFEYTIYSSCCNTDQGIYYYTTYENSQITGIDMHKEDLNSSSLIAYPLITDPQFFFQN